MGLFDRFFGGKKEEEERTVIAASGLPAFIGKLEAGERETLYSDAKPILEEIASLVEDIMDDLESIDSAEVPGNTPDRIRSILKTSKPLFIKTMQESVEGLDETPKIDELEPYRRRLEEFIASAPKTILGQGRYLHFSFSEELEGMRNDLRALFGKKKELDEVLKEGGSGGLGAEARAFMDLLSRRKALESEEKSLRKALKETEATEKVLSERYEGLEESDAYNDYLKNKKILEEAVKEREAIENKFFNLATPIKKAVKVLLHSSGEKDLQGVSRRDLSAYSEKPVEELMSHSSEERKIFFSRLKELLRDEALGLRGDKLDKASSRIDEILLPETEGRIKRLVFLKDEETRVSGLIDGSPYLSEKAELERGLDKSRREVAHLRDEHERIRKKVSGTAEEIATLKARLEENLSGLTGKRVSVEL